jgi:hypothetical protein
LQSVDAGVSDPKYPPWIWETLRVQLYLVYIREMGESAVTTAINHLSCTPNHEKFNLLAANESGVANKKKEWQILRRVE